MRISKSAHLKRLLQTQDVVITTLLFVATFDALWLLGRIPLEAVTAQLALLPLVVVIAVIASMVQSPRLSGIGLVGLARQTGIYVLLVLMGILLVIYFGRFQGISRTAFGIFAAALFVSLLVNRLALQWWYFRIRRESPSNFLKVLIIGNGPRAMKLIADYQRYSEWGVDIIGILDPDPGREAADARSPGGLRRLGGVDRIRDVLAENVVDEVVVCLPRSLLDRGEEVVAACEEEAVCVKFLADLYDMPGGTLSLETIGNLPVISLEPVPHDEARLIIKRVFDLLVTIPLLLVMLPVFLLVAVAIKLDSRGPVFFVQRRVGLNKRSFPMIKFRSMFVDAEARMADIDHLNEAEGPIFKIANDPRVTRVGRFLRKTSIDELPQLINVLLGHMSLVGPRPMSLRDVSLFNVGIQRRRFSVRPGLACLREVSGRSRLSFDRWLELDLKYIDEWSLWLDIKILLKIVPSVLKGDGAS
jgi:exopolysaccharide biosynthesis polyprenyl glycosylphosphotransferase